MADTIIFDLSEVLIAGLIGIERPLSARLELPQEKVLPAFAGSSLDALCCGRLTEDEYLGRITRQQGWKIGKSDLKEVIRNNLRQEVPGMKAVVRQLSNDVGLVLLSDHAREWVKYLRTIHPFLGVFDVQVFSYETGTLKKQPSTFERLLRRLNKHPQDCLFVDDSPTNIEVARSTGIDSIHFQGKEALLMELRGRGIPPYDAGSIHG